VVPIDPVLCKMWRGKCGSGVPHRSSARSPFWVVGLFGSVFHGSGFGKSIDRSIGLVGIDLRIGFLGFRIDPVD